MPEESDNEPIESDSSTTGDDTFVFPSAAVPQQPGDSIGPYKLLERLGEGGFGIVYLAEQREPVKRRVALKIIKLGMDTEQVVARFESERQALALMDHPNIATVLDAGATVIGRPYFVMEWVKGIPITEYCDQHSLRLKDRLELFTTVCSGIQHAHEKGVIHRDIKPSNILVTVQGNAPLAKVIDFGVAKATLQSLTDRTLVTQVHQVIGTPAYMSPEQADMSGLDIDTRSDVYSLGALLYELLTGSLPVDNDLLQSSGSEQLGQKLRDHQIIIPSARFAMMEQDKLSDIVERRQESRGTLIKSLRGDLDWIVLKALDKDRTKRYETPAALARDIQRHFANKPVSAAAPSKLYALTKMVRRNRVAFAVGAVFIATITAGLFGSIWGYLEARRAGEILSDELDLKVAAQQRITEQATVLEAQATKLRATVYRGAISTAVEAVEQDDWQGLEQHLAEAIRLGDAPEELHGWEWNWLHSLVPSRRLLEFGHFVHSYAISPDLTRVATGHDNIKLWDTQGEMLWEKAGKIDPRLRRYSEGSFSPKGTRVAFGFDDGTVKLWQVATGDLLWIKELPYKEVSTTLFDRSGDHIVISGTPTDEEPSHLSILDSRNGQVTSKLVPSDGQVRLWQSKRRLPHVSRLFRDALAARSHRAEPDENSPYSLNEASWEVASKPNLDEAQYRQALKWVDQALAKLDGRSLFLNTKGMAQYRLGEFQAAHETFEQTWLARLAKELFHDPIGYAEFEAGRAMALLHLDRIDDARDAGQKIQKAMKELAAPPISSRRRSDPIAAKPRIEKRALEAAIGRRMILSFSNVFRLSLRENPTSCNTLSPFPQ